jgi:DNA-binding response OmpR family regulator
MVDGCGRLILIVEDDPLAAAFLADHLTADGYEVASADGVAAAWRQLRTTLPALALVDLGLPDGDGLELIRRVRESDRVAGDVDPDLPLIVLSGRDGEVERLRGLDRGADDYVGKPYSILELGARIRAVLRRRDRPRAGARLRVGPLDVDVLARQAWLDGERLELSAKEFSLLRLLASEPARTFTRDELLREVWGYAEVVPTRTLDSHACRLRRKLARDGCAFVVNVWGVGYRLVDATPP